MLPTVMSYASDLTTYPSNCFLHSSQYRVSPDGTHTRVDNIEFGPYYRWDRSVSPEPEPFPPGFRMIAASNDPGGEESGSMLTEGCNFRNNGENCNFWEGQLFFPRQNYDFLGIALGKTELIIWSHSHKAVSSSSIWFINMKH